MKITPKWSSKRTTYEQKGRTYVPEIIYREMWLVEKTGVKILVEIAEATCYEKRAEDIEVIVSLYSTLPDTFAGTPIAFPLFLATKARPIFAKLSSRKNQLGISVSGQLPTYPR